MTVTALLLLTAATLLGGCALDGPKGKPTFDDILQQEGTSRAIVPMYLMNPDGTFRTNGLTPENEGEQM